MARNFNGSSDLLTYGAAILTAVPMTMACWIYPGTTTSKGVICLSDGTSNNRFQLNTGVGAVVSASSVAGGTGVSATTSATFAANVWAHICGVFASATDRRIFLNGANKATNSTSNTPSGINAFRLGADLGGSFYKGPMADCAIWNTALTDAEALLLGSNRLISPLQIRREALVWYAPLNGIGGVEIDLIRGRNLVVNKPSVYSPDPTPKVFDLRQDRQALAPPPPFVPWVRWPQLGPILAQ